MDDHLKVRQSNASIVSKRLANIIVPETKNSDRWRDHAYILIQCIIADAYEEEKSFWAAEKAMTYMRTLQMKEILVDIDRKFSARERIAGNQDFIAIYDNAKVVLELSTKDKSLVLARTHSFILTYRDYPITERIEKWEFIIKTFTHPE